MSGSLRVAVVDDHPLFRAVLDRTVTDAGGVVVAQAATATEGYDAVRATRPDVALVDIELGPDGDGIWLTRRLLAADGRLGVVLYTGASDPVQLRDGLDSGARGVVMKSSSPDRLLAALPAVAAGGTYIDPGAHELIRAHTESSGTVKALSVREREILAELSQGLTTEQIAHRLHLSSETVKSHVRNAMTKTGARNRTHAVVLALRRGELSLAGSARAAGEGPAGP